MSQSNISPSFRYGFNLQTVLYPGTKHPGVVAPKFSKSTKMIFLYHEITSIKRLRDDPRRLRTAPPMTVYNVSCSL